MCCQSYTACGISSMTATDCAQCSLQRYISLSSVEQSPHEMLQSVFQRNFSAKVCRRISAKYIPMTDGQRNFSTQIRTGLLRGYTAVNNSSNIRTIRRSVPHFSIDGHIEGKQAKGQCQQRKIFVMAGSVTLLKSVKLLCVIEAANLA